MKKLLCILLALVAAFTCLAGFAVSAEKAEPDIDPESPLYQKMALFVGDSICEATVMVKNVQDDGHLSVGKAVGLDVVRTSVDAMMAAINRDYARQK